MIDGDINRTIRLNPASQKAIKNYLEKENKNRPKKLQLTVNKAINKMIQLVGSDDFIQIELTIMKLEARGNRIKDLEKQIKKNAWINWGKITQQERDLFDNDLSVYIGEKYGVW
tara:strand:+ start:1467 stop:1808 length:342 start_codon:yes stop_codon:yes gene_type:complete